MNLFDYYNDKAVGYGMSSARKKCVMDLVPKEKKYILDIGCGKGVLAEALKKRGHRVAGVEISEKALKIAAKYLDEAHRFNIEDKEWPADLRNKKFDIIIASEVMEHLFSPDSFIRRAKRLLKDGGKMIITVPNFLYWRNRMKMLFGFFEYRDEGILDFGHIRFFTRKSLIKTLDGLGLRVEKENDFFPEFFPHFYKRQFSFIGRLFPGLFAFQIVLILSVKE